MSLSFQLQDLSKIPFQTLCSLIGTPACDALIAEQNRMVFVMLNSANNIVDIYQNPETKHFFQFDFEDAKNLTSSSLSIGLTNTDQKITPLVVLMMDRLDPAVEPRDDTVELSSLGSTAGSIKFTLSKKSHGELLVIENSTNSVPNTHHIIVEENAVLHNSWIFIQSKNSTRQDMSANRLVEIGENGVFHDQQIFVPQTHLAMQSKIKLLGESAKSFSAGCLLADSGQFYYEPIQEHFAKRAKSLLNFKVVLAKRAKSSFRGLVILHKDAQKSEAYQENKNLLLSRTARADSEPRLEIIPNDVMCKHGSATAELDSKQLYYMMSRGFDKQQAKTMIVKSFCKSAFSQENTQSLLHPMIPGIIDHILSTESGILAA